MPKDEALRQAKLHYLANVKGRQIASHPFLWASFIQSGDNSPIFINTKTSWSLYTFILANLLGLGLLFRYRKNRY